MTSGDPPLCIDTYSTNKTHICTNVLYIYNNYIVFNDIVLTLRGRAREERVSKTSQFK